MHIQAFGLTDVGRQRERNEDNYLIDDVLQLYVVCDGMGGHAAGEIASESAVQFASHYIRKHRTVLEDCGRTHDSYERVVQLAQKSVEEASRYLLEMSLSDPNCAGMGTTMTLLLVAGGKGIVAHVGDTRLYIQRNDQLHMLTTDHTLATELVRLGILRPEEAETSRYSHLLTRSIGQQHDVQVESFVFDLLAGDTCLLCSDGLTRYFSDGEELSDLLRNPDVANIPRQLVDLANSRGGRDNISTIVLRVANGQS